MKYYDLKIKKKVFETKDTCSFTLEVPAEHKERFSYKAGQFLTLVQTIDGEDIKRSYSFSSCPEVESDLILTIKKIDKGKFSSYAVDILKEGNTIKSTPPAGLFVLPKDLSDTLVFFSGGSGITAIFSLMKAAIKKSPQAKVFLLYVNRDEENIIFKNQLKNLEISEEKRISITHQLTKAGSAVGGLSGRPTVSSIENYIKSIDGYSNAQYFICGPEGFMKTCFESYSLLDIKKTQIFSESYNNSTEVKTVEPVATEYIVIGDDSFSPVTEAEVEIILDGEKSTYKVNAEQSILESLIEQGANPPYSCMDGNCMACLATISSGVVGQKDYGILTDENIEARECLTCQAFPGSSKITIDFDQF